MEKNSWLYSSVPSQLNHKIKSLWVKHLWFYSNHENHEDITPPLYSTTPQKECNNEKADFAVAVATGK